MLPLTDLVAPIPKPITLYIPSTILSLSSLLNVKQYVRQSSVALQHCLIQAGPIGLTPLMSDDEIPARCQPGTRTSTILLLHRTSGGRLPSCTPLRSDTMSFGFSIGDFCAVGNLAWVRSLVARENTFWLRYADSLPRLLQSR